MLYNYYLLSLSNFRSNFFFIKVTKIYEADLAIKGTVHSNTFLNYGGQYGYGENLYEFILIEVPFTKATAPRFLYFWQ